MPTLIQITQSIMQDPDNRSFTEKGIEPLFAAPTTARMFAVIPMDFYYPGKGKSGDLPPRKDFAEKWHPAILANLPNIELTILIGQYAQKYYLPENNLNVTETVHHFRDFLPHFLPLVHPSPRNQIWLKKNPWFEQEIVPTLQKQVKAILSR